MDELKLLEKMLRQRDKGELPDYQGTDLEEQQVVASERMDRDGIIQGWLDEFRWKKNEELIPLLADPGIGSSFAYMAQQCAMQVLLEREGENWLKKVIAQHREEFRKEEEWRRQHGVRPEEQEAGFSAGAGREEARQQALQKDAKGVGGVRKGELGSERGQARAGDLQAHRQAPLSHSIASGAWGHMETAITDRAKATQTGGHFKVELLNLDLNTQIFIRSRHDQAWSSIEEFEDHYGKAHDTSFATYDGVLLHENQHVQERIAVFNKHLPAFRNKVAAIEVESEEEALAQYEELFEAFEQTVDEEYHAIGEVPARALEWEYYHEAFEQETGARGASRSSARAAGAAQGKEETKHQQSTLTMNALAAPQRAAEQEQEQEEGDLPARVALHLVPRPVEFAEEGEEADSRSQAVALPQTLEIGPSSLRPRLVALVSNRNLGQGGARETMRVSGTRPVFGIGEQAQVIGAKAGVTLGRSPDWLELQGSREGTVAGLPSPEAAVEWLLSWWSEGAEEERAGGQS